jgi:hypothetical protein
MPSRPNVKRVYRSIKKVLILYHVKKGEHVLVRTRTKGDVTVCPLFSAAKTGGNGYRQCKRVDNDTIIFLHETTEVVQFNRETSLAEAVDE